MAPASALVGASVLLLALGRGARAQMVLESHSPLFSPASGGVVLSIRGGRIPLVNNITCSWEEPTSGDVVTAKTRLPADFDDTLQVAAEIECTAPRWPYRAGTVDFFLEENGAVLTTGWNFTYIAGWTEVSPSSGPAVGRPQVEVTGFGFDPVRSGVGLFQEPLTPGNGTFNYTLRFSAGSFATSVPAVALTDRTLVAFQPLWRFPPLLTQIEVLHDGETVPQVTFTTPEETGPTQGVDIGDETATEATQEQFDYRVRGKVVSGDVYRVNSSATAPYTIASYCQDTDEDEVHVVAVYTQGDRISAGSFAVAVSGERAVPHVPINFTAPAVSSAAMRAALANISRVQVHSVQGRAFKHRMGYTALLLLVRLTVSQAHPPLRTQQAIDVQSLQLTGNSTSFFLQNVTRGNDTVLERQYFDIEYHGAANSRQLAEGSLDRRECLYCPTVIDSGWNHVVGITASSDGAIRTPFCFGENGDNQCDIPANFLGANPRSVGAGKSHTCGLRADGTARCWGPEPPSTLDKRGMPDNVPMVSLSAGSYHTCAARKDASLRCAGEDMYTKTLIPDSRCEQRVEVPRQLWRVCATNSSFLGYAITAGMSHSCGLDLRTQDARCWGQYINGEGGEQQGTDPSGNPLFGMPGPFKEIHAGVDFTCALRTDGTLECWGRNNHGQVCAPNEPDRKYIQLAVGLSHACAVEAGTYAVRCWGRNVAGESDDPEGRFLRVTAGELHSCGVLLEDGSNVRGKVVCWGRFRTTTENPKQGARLLSRSSPDSAQLWQPSGASRVVTEKCTLALEPCAFERVTEADTFPTIKFECYSRTPCPVAEPSVQWSPLAFWTTGAIFLGYFLLLQPTVLPQLQAPRRNNEK